LGDGHAVLSALPFVDAHEPVAVLFGDDIITGRKPALKQLMDVYKTYEDPVIALQEVPKSEVSNYGVIGGQRLDERTWSIHTFVEKPSVREAPSNLIFVGRAILTPKLFSILEHQKPGKDGEIRLADAFITYLKKKKALYGCAFEGTRHDCGSKLGFLKAQIELGMRHPEIGPGLRAYIKTLS
jgi:UTP--glucose-1-phosphate uridylyltransferase